MFLKKFILILILFAPIVISAGVHEYREHSDAVYTRDLEVLKLMYARDTDNLDVLEQIIKMQYALEDFPSAAVNSSTYLKKKKSKEIHYIYIMSICLQSQYDRAAQELSLYRSLYKIDDKEEKILTDKIALIRRNSDAQAYPSSKKTEWGAGKLVLGVVPASGILIGYDRIDDVLFAYSTMDKAFVALPVLPAKTDYSKAVSLSFSDDLRYIAGSFRRGDKTEVLISKKDGNHYTKWDRYSSLNQGTLNSSAHFARGLDLIMVSNRLNKNLDVFYAKKTDDKVWELTPISGVNTVYDEAMISLSQDKKTLYISSNGYPGSGGFDTYRAQMVYSERPGSSSLENVKEMNSFRNACVPYVTADGLIFFSHIVSDIPYVHEYSVAVASVSPQPDDTAIVDTSPEVVARALQFETGSAVILRVSYPYLNEIVDYMKNNPGKRLAITGHTDNSGTDNINERLALERARSVAAYLTARGINPSRIDIAGKGAEKPIASNDTEEGRAQNRRVELEFKD